MAGFDAIDQIVEIVPRYGATFRRPLPAAPSRAVVLEVGPDREAPGRDRGGAEAVCASGSYALMQRSVQQLIDF
jgi:hypothetical protein